MNSVDKKKEKKPSYGGLIAFIIIILISALDRVSGDSETFAIVAVAVIFFFALIAVVGKAKKGKKAAKPVPQAKKSPAKDAIPKAAPVSAPVRKYYDSDCQKMSADHDHNRRLEQLEGFLRDGIISREEYNILKGKYMR